MPYDQRGSELLGEDECKRLLASAGASGHIGRLAISREGSPYVIPVNFSYHEEAILIRLGPGLRPITLTERASLLKSTTPNPTGGKAGAWLSKDMPPS